MSEPLTEYQLRLQRAVLRLQAQAEHRRTIGVLLQRIEELHQAVLEMARKGTAS